uniref:Uncharacterized protein n=1 Tax=Oryza punctata TaxID=4537 RepID=A0A0E0KTA8_ORYPU
MEQIEGGGGRGGEVHGGGRSRWRAPAEVHIRMARSTSSLPSLSSFLPIVRCSSTDAPPPGASFPAIPPALKLATVWIEAAEADGACDGAEWIQKRCCGERQYSGRFIEAMPTEREEDPSKKQLGLQTLQTGDIHKQ